MKNKISSRSILAVEQKKYSKILEGWKVSRPLKNTNNTWSVTIEKHAGFTREEKRNYINRNMKLAKKKEKLKVLIVAIVMFAVLFSIFLFSLIKMGVLWLNQLKSNYQKR
jgi:hypothetical protein